MRDACLLYGVFFFLAGLRRKALPPPFWGGGGEGAYMCFRGLIECALPRFPVL